ncbi:MAG: CinA family nicotinamide mononucleotide deamidase-related protein [Planctomycetota bacterium]|nr:CinA family nicotinamide mononucleotide deamidase-related protein [Planctomycetota bacterium]
MSNSNKSQGTQAIILGIGDELLRGDYADLNSSLLARTLLQHGWTVLEIRVVPDDLHTLADAMADAGKRADLVISTGGLGPTDDDLTRHAAARAGGCELGFQEGAWQMVLDWYGKSDRTPPESNRRQALVPEGATPLHNPSGTAPGLRMELGRATLFCLPGPPREVGPMVELELKPWLGLHGPEGQFLHTSRVYLASLSESQFADEAGALLERHAHALVGVTAQAGRLAVTITARAATPEQAKGSAEAIQAQFLERFASHVYSTTEPTLEKVLGLKLIERGISVTVAESCTLGLVAAALGGVSGISKVLSETYCTYSNGAKTRRLGVDTAMLEQHGAVSEPVAQAMALGAAREASARLSVAITGLAGPDGGTEAKPVGLVCFACALDGQVVAVESKRFAPAGRAAIRAWATNRALHLLLLALGAPA